MLLFCIKLPLHFFSKTKCAFYAKLDTAYCLYVHMLSASLLGDLICSVPYALVLKHFSQHVDLQGFYSTLLLWLA